MEYFKGNKTYEGEVDNIDFQNNSLGFYKKYNTNTCMIVPIDEDIKAPVYYRNIVLALSELTENDMVQFNINSPGGDLYGLISLLTAVQDTKAFTVANIVGQANSSASFLALHCDAVELSPYSTMLVHSGSYFGIDGKSSDVKGYIQHLESIGEALVRETYAGFLTEGEIIKVLDGMDLWFNAKEIYTRLEKRNELRQKELEQDKTQVLTPLEISEEVKIKKSTPRKPRKKISKGDKPVDNSVDNL